MKNSWTFGIITDGNNPERVEDIVQNIHSQFTTDDEFEIIIVGFKRDGRYLGRRRVLEVEFDETVKPAWITKKKNIVAEMAAHPNVCLMHDYVTIGSNWCNDFKNFGYDWKSCVTPIYNTNGRLFRFWCTAGHDAGVDMQDDLEGRFGFRCMRAGLRGFERWQYYSGAFFCAKKEVLEKVPLNEDLVWGESEDIEWSRRMYLEYGENAFACNVHASAFLLKKKEHAPWENLSLM
jgi:hypothetical protein